MQRPLIRIFSILVLVSSLFCFSGVARACVLISDPAAAADSCCPADRQQTDDTRDGDSSLECPCCTSYASAMTVSAISVPSFAITDATHPRYQMAAIPAGFLASIDRPPESV